MDNRNSSSTWCQILNFSQFSKEVQEVAWNGIIIKVGNGASTRFWLDKWTGKDTLKSLFPRLFMVSTQQNNLIENMGKWEENRWVWKFNWRRRLFVWEEDLVKDLYLAVDHDSMSESARDVRLWAFDKSGSFSVSNFYQQVCRIVGQGSNRFCHGKLVWKNVAPLRAQLLVWFVQHDRLNTNERLFRFRFPGVEDELCVFCGEEPETVYHIIFGCRFSSSLWYFGCNCWNLAFCLPKDPMVCFLTWMDAPFTRFDLKIWSSLFYVISWSIWWLRNKVIFQKRNRTGKLRKDSLFGDLEHGLKGGARNFLFRQAKCMRTYLKLEDGRSIIAKATLTNIKVQCSSPCFLVYFA